ncbi:hypothetical protein KRR39_20780 [Nocardioides panacis]|uniref:Uncharacterized protein n=1 Tax=Nocardioides panacis TaxID=2849501 RepID=A0A975SXQ0_9ACTN|nr:hypothetical protein [Nocardioides panacis]QWZ07796.1 hypothetical protein KRR39_20780 [Nocardioides panacis]
MLELQEGHIGVDGWDLGFCRLDIAVVELGERPAGGPRFSANLSEYGAPDVAT